MQNAVRVSLGLSAAMQALKRGEIKLAEAELRACLEFAPHSVAVLNNLSSVLILSNDYAAARDIVSAALAQNEQLAEAWLNLGLIEEEDAGDLERALSCFDRAIQIRQDYPEAHYNRGNVLARQQQLTSAATSYRTALHLSPRYADAWNNLGNVLREQGDLDQALKALDTAVKVQPQADAYTSRGYVLRDQNQYLQAVKSFDKALRLDAQTPEVFGIRLHTLAQLCDWQGWDGALGELAARIDRGELASPPFCVLSLIDSGVLQRQSARAWVAQRYSSKFTLGPFAGVPAQRPLRVGYFSADLHEHPVAEFLLGIIESHDRSQVHCSGFSYGKVVNDSMRARLAAGFDTFLDVGERSDRAIASLARQHALDIAIDLGGYTSGSRPGIFELRAAPIQASYLGYPGTLGAVFIDYLLADETLIPEGSSSWYQEKIAYLPTFFANDFRTIEASPVQSRASYGLPQQSFVFACFNNSWKLDPSLFQVWMNILKAVPDGVLFLVCEQPAVRVNLCACAEAAGIKPARLVFGARLSKADYLARYQVADLFLDSFCYAAGTTAVDALWMGLPVLSRVGTTFCTRLAASALVAVGLPDLVVDSKEAYQSLAIALAHDRPRLLAYQQKLQHARNHASLFDPKRQAQAIEASYVAMAARYQAGLAPEHIRIDPVLTTVASST